MLLQLLRMQLLAVQTGGVESYNMSTDHCRRLLPARRPCIQICDMHPSGVPVWVSGHGKYVNCRIGTREIYANQQFTSTLLDTVPSHLLGEPSGR